MVAFQCSPLSTPDGIVGTFNQCASYQIDKDLDRFVSVVVLDEIGLAEDSPRMPLKVIMPCFIFKRILYSLEFIRFFCFLGQMNGTLVAFKKDVLVKYFVI